MRYSYHVWSIFLTLTFMGSWFTPAIKMEMLFQKFPYLDLSKIKKDLTVVEDYTPKIFFQIRQYIHLKCDDIRVSKTFLNGESTVQSYYWTSWGY